MPKDTVREITGSEFFRVGTIDEIVRADDGADTREVWVACSSEEPVDRWFGREVLVHEKKAIDRSFISGGTAPVLNQHMHDAQIGVVKKITLGNDRKLRALLRFSKSAAASEVYDDVLDGIRSNVSIGYRIKDHEEIKDKDGNVTEVRITKWLPFEVSMVSVPADMTVGVGRSNEPNLIERGAIVPDPVTPQTIDVAAIARDAANAATELANEAAATRAAKSAESAESVATRRAEEATDIMELGAAHNMGTEAAAHVRGGGSISEFRGIVLTNIGDSAPLAQGNDIGLSSREIEDFSILRLVRASVTGASASDRDAASLEREACDAAADAAESTPNGFMLPSEVMRNFITEDMARTLLAGTDTQLVPTEHRAQSYIDILRNASSVMRAGARTLPGLHGNVDIPRMITTAGAAWLATEDASSADAEPTWDTVSLTPKDISRSTPMSRRMRQQSSPAIEGLVRMDIVQSMALGIDLGALEGSGASGQPTGVLNQTGVNAPTSFAAVNPTFPEVIAMETAVADDNALMGSLAYIGRTNMYGALKSTKKDAGSGEMVVEPGGTVNGYQYIQSNQGTDGNLYFGNWADVLIGMWGGLDLVMDEATKAASGGLYIRAFQTIDVAVRHGQSFAFNNDGV